MKHTTKLQRFYFVTLDLWDCNRHPYKVWNIIDRKSKTTIVQGRNKEVTQRIVDLLNKDNK